MLILLHGVYTFRPSTVISNEEKATTDSGALAAAAP